MTPLFLLVITASALNALLSHQPFLEGAGTAFGPCDISLTFSFLAALTYLPEEEGKFLTPYPALINYLDKMCTRPAAVDVLPKQYMQSWRQYMESCGRQYTSSGAQGGGTSPETAAAGNTNNNDIASGNDGCLGAAMSDNPPAGNDGKGGEGKEDVIEANTAGGEAGAGTAGTGAEAGREMMGFEYKFEVAGASGGGSVPHNAPIVMFSAPMTRGWVMEWYLEELLGVVPGEGGESGEVEVRLLDFHGPGKGHKSREFLRVNPFGR
jgi:hypothetical protein